MLKAAQLFSLLLMIAAIMPGCSKTALFKTGKIKKEKRQFKAFTEIDLYDKVNLVLTQDSVNGIWVEAGENLLDAIQTTIAGGKLVIRDNSSFKWSRNLDYTITVYVHTALLSRITYYGAGKISSTNTLLADKFSLDSFNGIGSADLSLECNYAELFIRMANADFTLRGKARYTRMYCADYGSMNLSGFQSQDLNVDYRSIRDSRINVTGSLSGKINYKGSIYFTGNPNSTVTMESSGQLIHMP